MAIVQCENCGTKYRFPDERFSPKGIKVRCTRCGHVFLLKGRKRKNAPSKKLILIVALVLIVGIGFWAGKKFSSKLGFLTSLFKKEKALSKVKGVVFEDVKQYFVDNEKVGRLLVIEGKVVNKSEVPKRFIKIRATLYDKKGRVASRKTIFAGNTLTLYQLQLFTQKEIEDTLNSKIGILTKNSNILPGQSVPFMIVFYDPSDRISEFSLQISQALTIKTPIKTVK